MPGLTEWQKRKKAVDKARGKKKPTGKPSGASKKKAE